MSKNYEKELPEGYELIFRIDATKKSTAVKMNIGAFILMIGVFLIGCIPFIFSGELDFTLTSPEFIVCMVIFIGSMIFYIIAHELVHGIAYKALTGQRLTFGMTLSCAFCGVPDIYTYRRCALIALLSPFTVFTVLFTALAVSMYFVHPLYYICALWLLAMHIGGCVGDLYMSYLCFTRFKDKRILMRDTGPAQFVYSPKKED